MFDKTKLPSFRLPSTREIKNALSLITMTFLNNVNFVNKLFRGQK